MNNTNFRIFRSTLARDRVRSGYLIVESFISSFFRYRPYSPLLIISPHSLPSSSPSPQNTPQPFVISCLSPSFPCFLFSLSPSPQYHKILPGPDSVFPCCCCCDQKFPPPKKSSGRRKPSLISVDTCLVASHGYF